MKTKNAFGASQRRSLFLSNTNLAPGTGKLNRIRATIAAIRRRLLSTFTLRTRLGTAGGTSSRLTSASRLLRSLTAFTVAVRRMYGQCIITVGLLVVADLRVSSDACLSTRLFTEIRHRPVFSYSLLNVSSSS